MMIWGELWNQKELKLNGQKQTGKKLSFIWNFERDEKVKKNFKYFGKKQHQKNVQVKLPSFSLVQIHWKKLSQFSERKEKEPKLKLGELKPVHKKCTS